MPLYHVEVDHTRYKRFFVEAPDYETAREDAEELVGEIKSDEWDEDDRQFDLWPAGTLRPPRPGDPVWTGGPNGQWEEIE